jgi:hypothetical protein
MTPVAFGGFSIHANVEARKLYLPELLQMGEVGSAWEKPDL